MFTVTVGHLGDTYKPLQQQGGRRSLVLDSLQPCGGLLVIEELSLKTYTVMLHFHNPR